jgi:hypothetical protein
MKRLLLLLSLLAAGLVTLVTAPTAGAQVSGGPVVLMGIDAEDGGPGGHGPPATYTRLVNNILAQTTKVAPTQLIVIGCKPGTDTGTFWATVFPAAVCVQGGAAITALTFQEARMYAVVSDELNTPFGGLTCHDEDPALDDPTTQTEIAAHVNAGGAILGFSSDCPRPFQYISGVAQIGVNVGGFYSDIDPTTEGLALGIDDTLDVVAWHDTFQSFPSFLKVLAFEAGTANAAAIGGRSVTLPPVVVPTRLELTPKRSENVVDSEHTVNAVVYDQFDRPMQGVAVTFNVTGASGTIQVTHTTDKDGVATLTYQGPALPGQDTIVACVERDPADKVCDPTDQPSDVATKTWILPVSTPNCAVDMNKETGGGQIIAQNGDRISFGGNAKVGPHGETTGEQEVRSHGPKEPFIYHGNVIAVVCQAANPTLGTPGRATIFTMSSNAGSITGLARIDVQDFGEPGSNTTDTYRFRLSNYDTGEQPLKSGNIQIHKG